MITEKGLTYEERLKTMYHNTGDEKTAWRLNRGFFLIFQRFDAIKHTDFFTRSFTGLRRGHELKLFKPPVCLECQENFSLPVSIINCGTIQLFNFDCF